MAQVGLRFNKSGCKYHVTHIEFKCNNKKIIKRLQVFFTLNYYDHLVEMIFI